MAENKKQHFVPRFYLKRFSCDAGARIHLLHIKSRRVIEYASLRDQCSGPYFYGNNLSIEKKFAEIEAICSQTVSKIVESKTLPAHGSIDDLILRTHVCLQHGRTESWLTDQTMLTNKLLDVLYAGNREPAEVINLRKDRDIQVRSSINSSANAVIFIGDLKVKLIDAVTLGNFATSDCPVILLNPFYFGRYAGGIYGFAVKGLVIAIPLSPKLLLFMYDSTCYKTGSNDERLIKLNEGSEITTFNDLQISSAKNCVYFSDKISAQDSSVRLSELEKYRTEDRVKVQEGQLLNSAEPKTVIHSFSAPCKFNPKIHFLKLRRSMRGHQGKVKKLAYRDPELLGLYREFSHFSNSSGIDFLEFIISHIQQNKNI